MYMGQGSWAHYLLKIIDYSDVAITPFKSGASVLQGRALGAGGE